MLEKQNKVIIVDNSPNQLEILGKSFFENGLGCRTFVYDVTYDEPLEKVRIAFFDINLTEKAVDSNYESNEEILEKNTAVFNDLANAIGQYISSENGPYVLIFWTANSKIVDAFKLYMRDPKRGFADIPSPILIDCIDKTPFVESDDEATLSDQVLKLLNSDEKIKFLFDFEDNAKNAGENTLNRLYYILPKDDEWGESTQLFENLDKVLSKVSASALGFQHAKENPRKGIYEGLLPILNYEFLNSSSDVAWNNIVNQLNTATKYDQIISPDINIQHKMNTLYHIEDYTTQNKDTRGCVIQLDKNSTDLLTSLNIARFDEWFNDLIPIEDNTIKRDIRNRSLLVAVEFSAACDYSNKKKRINKYILGVITDHFDIKTQLVKDRKSESSYHIGGCCFHHNNTNYNIWLNLNYVFGAFANDTRFGEPLFILKKEIMDMLGNKYASHISRIGITSL